MEGRKKGNPAIKPYADKTLQLSSERNCFLWGSRLVIPPTHRKEVVVLLLSKMKALARSYVCWSKMDLEIEELVKGCRTVPVYANVIKSAT